LKVIVRQHNSKGLRVSSNLIAPRGTQNCVTVTLFSGQKWNSSSLLPLVQKAAVQLVAPSVERVQDFTKESLGCESNNTSRNPQLDALHCLPGTGCCCWQVTAGMSLHSRQHAVAAVDQDSSSKQQTFHTSRAAPADAGSWPQQQHSQVDTSSNQCCCAWRAGIPAGSAETPTYTTRHGCSGCSCDQAAVTCSSQLQPPTCSGGDEPSTPGSGTTHWAAAAAAAAAAASKLFRAPPILLLLPCRL